MAVTPVVVYVESNAPKQGVIVGVGPQASRMVVRVLVYVERFSPRHDSLVVVGAQASISVTLVVR